MHFTQAGVTPQVDDHFHYCYYFAYLPQSISYPVTSYRELCTHTRITTHLAAHVTLVVWQIGL